MLGIVFALSANFVFSISNVFFKRTEKDTSPTMINLFRTSVGVVTFLILALVFNIFNVVFQIPLYIIGFLILSSILGQVIGDTAYFFSQQYLGPAKALAVSLTYPFFTIIIDIVFLDGEFDLWILLGAFIITGGVLLIAYSQKVKDKQNILSKEQIRKEVLLGIIFAFVASISWAVGIIYTDLSMNEINTLFSTDRLTSIVGTMVRFPIAIVLLFGINFSLYGIYRHKERINPEIEFKESQKYRFRGRSKYSWMWLVTGSIIGTSIGVYFFTEAAYLAGAVTMALMTTTGPVFSILLDWIVNKEKISSLGFLGILVTLGGVILIILV